MRQLFQSLKSGETLIANIPTPSVPPGKILIRTSHSLISSGTERMFLNFGRSGIIGKVKQQPDKVNQVLQKVQTDGLIIPFDSVYSKLDPIPLGYCNVGTVFSRERCYFFPARRSCCVQRISC